jgi:hypothetical protein
MLLGHWQFFKDFFKIGFLRYLLFWFAVVPIFVKLFSGLPEHLKIPGTEHFLTFSLPFTWWFLWLASLSYFVAFVLFQAFCPQFIKRYPSYTEYKAHGHSPRWVIWEFYYAVEGPGRPTSLIGRLWKNIYDTVSPITQTDKIFERVITKKYALETIEKFTDNPQVEENQTTAFFVFQDKEYKIFCDPSTDDIVVKEKEIFWEVFGHFAKQGSGVRALIQILIAITAAFLMIVLIEHIVSVVRLVI